MLLAFQGLNSVQAFKEEVCREVPSVDPLSTLGTSSEHCFRSPVIKCLMHLQMSFNGTRRATEVRMRVLLGQVHLSIQA